MYANGQLGAIPLACSLMTSFVSAVTLLGVSAENYSYGTMFVVNNVAYMLGVLISTFLFVPVYFNAGVNGAYQVCKFCQLKGLLWLLVLLQS